MEEENNKGSIPEATVVKDGKNQKKISCFTRTVVHYPCVVMLISGVISIIVRYKYIQFSFCTLAIDNSNRV